MLTDCHGFIYDALKNNKENIIFEFGMHIGQDTVKLASIPNATVHGFECDPRNLRVLNVPENVIVNPCAIGSENTEMQFYQSDAYKGVSNKWTASGSIKKPLEHLNYYPQVSFKKETITVISVTLDQYCKANNIDHIDFIWADIQGAEIDMIMGGKEMLQRTKYLYCEFSIHELYKGQKGLDAIIKEIPWFKIIKVYGFNKAGESNALLENEYYGRTS